MCAKAPEGVVKGACRDVTSAKAALPKIKEESEIIKIVGVFWLMPFQRKLSFFLNLKMPIKKKSS